MSSRTLVELPEDYEDRLQAIKTNLNRAAEHKNKAIVYENTASLQIQDLWEAIAEVPEIRSVATDTEVATNE